MSVSTRLFAVALAVLAGDGVLVVVTVGVWPERPPGWVPVAWVAGWVAAFVVAVAAGVCRLLGR